MGFDVDDEDVILKSRCIPRSLLGVNGTLDEFYKYVTRLTVFRLLWSMVS